MNNKINNQKSIKSKGFSLLEMIIAIFIFVVVMVTMSSIYVRFYSAQKRAKLVQQNSEDARFMMESMAKILRTSKLISCNGATSCPVPPATTNSVEVYDSFQDLCIVYKFDSADQKVKSLEIPPATSKDPATCNFSGTASPIINNFVYNMKFLVVQSVANTTAGKMTILAEVCSDQLCSLANKDKTILQTSVSMRN